MDSRPAIGCSRGDAIVTSEDSSLGLDLCLGLGLGEDRTDRQGEDRTDRQGEDRTDRQTGRG